MKKSSKSWREVAEDLNEKLTDLRDFFEEQGIPCLLFSSFLADEDNQWHSFTFNGKREEIEKMLMFQTQNILNTCDEKLDDDQKPWRRKQKVK